MVLSCRIWKLHCKTAPRDTNNCNIMLSTLLTNKTAVIGFLPFLFQPSKVIPKMPILCFTTFIEYIENIEKYIK